MALPIAPKVSIVTVVYNNATTIGQCLASVRAQSYKHIEHIVIDGGSSDGTLDVIRQCADSLAFWVSEQDGGIYDAMNKGLNQATGELIGILNSDDWLEPLAIETIVACFRESGGDFSYGDAFVADEAGVIIGRKCVEEPLESALPYRMPFAHQTFYVRRAVIEQLGSYNVRYRLSADLDYVCRAVALGFKGCNFGAPQSTFRLGGASGGVRTFLETRRIAQRHGMGRIASWCRFTESLLKMAVVVLLPRAMTDFIRSRLGSSYKPAVGPGADK